MSWAESSVPRDPAFALATADGKLVEGPNYQGYRDAFDGVRYLSTLTVTAKQAQNRGGAAEKGIAAEALTWIEDIEPVTVDLDEMRATTIGYILELSHGLPDIEHTRSRRRLEPR